MLADSLSLHNYCQNNKLLYMRTLLLNHQNKTNSALTAKSSLLFLLFFVTSSIFANVVVTGGTGGTNTSADKAANATSPAFTTLTNIVITEGANSDFPGSVTNATFTLSAPAGWAFNAGVGTVSSKGAPEDITAISINVTASTITITYSTNTANKSDIVTISGIQVRATDGANVPGSGNIVFSAASLVSCALDN